MSEEADLSKKMAGISLEDKKLKSFDINGVAEYIKSGKAKNIVLMTGAGISCAAGIPDFRSIGTGLYSNLEKYNLPNPTDVFDLKYFEQNPEPFFDLVPDLLPGGYKPTAVHCFGKILDSKGILVRQYTQNIDGLERQAGVDVDHLVECHGTFFTAHCRKCNYEYDLDSIRADLMKKQVLHCKQDGCDGIVKPDIVFFHENLPPRFRECCRQDLNKADLLIIIGTSLKVNPFASLTSMVREEVPRILINNDKVAQYIEEVDEIDGQKIVMLPPNHRALLRYDHPSNTRDVYLGGDCQDTIKQLAELIGWGNELNQLIKSQ